MKWLYTALNKGNLCTQFCSYPQDRNPEVLKPPDFQPTTQGLLVFPKEKGMDEETKDKGQVAVSHLLKRQQ